ETGLVIALDAERCAGRGHIHREPQHLRRFRAAVDEIADKYDAATITMRADTPALALGALIAQPIERCAELVLAAVHIADDVERSEIPAPVGVERVADDRRSLDRLHRREREDTSEPLMLQAAKRLAQEPHL